MIIDATDLIVGRLGAFVAKKALLGESIDIINAEKAVITGGKNNVVAHYKHERDRGHPYKGPYLPVKEDRFVRRMIRGMLPYKNEKGASAFKRIRCYTGVPEDLKDKKGESIQTAHVSKMQNLKYMTVKEICHLLGKRE
ncbi:MAG: 50S ribosomal protein L13 [Nanoarchaeota archaeon]